VNLALPYNDLKAVIPAKAGIHYQETGFLFAQEALDSGSGPE